MYHWFDQNRLVGFRLSDERMLAPGMHSSCPQGTGPPRAGTPLSGDAQAFQAFFSDNWGLPLAPSFALELAILNCL